MAENICVIDVTPIPPTYPYLPCCPPDSSLFPTSCPYNYQTPTPYPTFTPTPTPPTCRCWLVTNPVNAGFETCTIIYRSCILNQNVSVLVGPGQQVSLCSYDVPYAIQTQFCGVVITLDYGYCFDGVFCDCTPTPTPTPTVTPTITPFVSTTTTTFTGTSTTTTSSATTTTTTFTGTSTTTTSSATTTTTTFTGTSTTTTTTISGLCYCYTVIYVEATTTTTTFADCHCLVVTYNVPTTTTTTQPTTTTTTLFDECHCIIVTYNAPTTTTTTISGLCYCFTVLFIEDVTTTTTTACFCYAFIYIPSDTTTTTTQPTTTTTTLFDDCHCVIVTYNAPPTTTTTTFTGTSTTTTQNICGCYVIRVGSQTTTTTIIPDSCGCYLIKVGEQITTTTTAVFCLTYCYSIQYNFTTTTGCTLHYTECGGNQVDVVIGDTIWPTGEFSICAQSTPYFDSCSLLSGESINIIYRGPCSNNQCPSTTTTTSLFSVQIKNSFINSINDIVIPNNINLLNDDICDVSYYDCQGDLQSYGSISAYTWYYVCSQSPPFSNDCSLYIVNIGDCDSPSCLLPTTTTTSQATTTSTTQTGTTTTSTTQTGATTTSTTQTGSTTTTTIIPTTTTTTNPNCLCWYVQLTAGTSPCVIIYTGCTGIRLPILVYPPPAPPIQICSPNRPDVQNCPLASVILSGTCFNNQCLPFTTTTTRPTTTTTTFTGTTTTSTTFSGLCYCFTVIFVEDLTTTTTIQPTTTTTRPTTTTTTTSCDCYLVYYIPGESTCNLNFVDCSGTTQTTQIGYPTNSDVVLVCSLSIPTISNCNAPFTFTQIVNDGPCVAGDCQTECICYMIEWDLGTNQYNVMWLDCNNVFGANVQILSNSGVLYVCSFVPPIVASNIPIPSPHYINITPTQPCIQNLIDLTFSCPTTTTQPTTTTTQPTTTTTRPTTTTTTAWCDCYNVENIVFEATNILNYYDCQGIQSSINISNFNGVYELCIQNIINPVSPNIQITPTGQNCVGNVNTGFNCPVTTTTTSNDCPCFCYTINNTGTTVGTVEAIDCDDNSVVDSIPSGVTYSLCYKSIGRTTGPLSVSGGTQPCVTPGPGLGCYCYLAINFTEPQVIEVPNNMSMYIFQSCCTGEIFQAGPYPGTFYDGEIYHLKTIGFEGCAVVNSYLSPINSYVGITATQFNSCEFCKINYPCNN